MSVPASRSIDVATELAEGFVLPPCGVPIGDLGRLTLSTGESFHERHLVSRHDEALMEVVSTAYLAAGMHSGDPVLLGRTARELAARGIAIGVHPSYPDVFRFGQHRVALEDEDLMAALLFQFGAVAAITGSVGARMRSVKCHGALSFDVAHDERCCGIMVKAILAFDPELMLVCMSGSVSVEIASSAGLRVLREAYVDRGYDERGRIVSRREPKALVTDPARAAEQAIRIVTDGEVVSVNEQRVPLAADTLCLHSDTPGAGEIARTLARSFEARGIAISAPGWRRESAGRAFTER